MMDSITLAVTSFAAILIGTASVSVLVGAGVGYFTAISQKEDSDDR